MTGSSNYNNNNKISIVLGVIEVHYPSGSTCTCTNGILSINAPDTSGHVLFSLNVAGNWTVSCTNGTNLVSKTISITTFGTLIRVDLGYNLILAENGVQKVPWECRESPGDTPVWNGTMQTNFSNGDYTYFGMTSDKWRSVKTVNKYNLSPYNTLSFRTLTNTNAGNYINTYIWQEHEISDGSQITVGMAYEMGVGNGSIINYDISNLTGEWYIGMISGGVRWMYINYVELKV